MTRFARASGSKASNERAPEDGTPWEVMKEQLLKSKIESEESKKREAAEKQRIENYDKFLKEHKVQKRPASWCDFPEVQESVKKVKKPNSNKQKQVTGDHENNDKSLNKRNKKKKPTEIPGQEVVENNQPQVPSSENNKNKKKKKKKAGAPVQDLAENSQPQVEQTKSNKNKKKNKKRKSNPQSNGETGGETVSQTENDCEQNEPPAENNVNPGDKQKQNTKKKNKKKLVNGQPPRRKVIDDNSFQLIINGKEVELVRYDSFPIMKKDADRLNDLKANMIRRGIPKSEIQRNMKLERRRAEKALARLKREVCYNCRKGGHNLSDCPELKSKMPGAGGADGVCFKCGSTEHRQFECKVQKDKEFRFATCFICKEPGHIARQCPDNPKGLYPNGGGCKLCGDVTHLRKDCPTVSDQREQANIKLPTLFAAPEDAAPPAPAPAQKSPKKVKF